MRCSRKKRCIMDEKLKGEKRNTLLHPHPRMSIPKISPKKRASDRAIKLWVLVTRKCAIKCA
jgi:hypothetical protein